MTYPFFATPYPDAQAAGPILGVEQRSLLGVMVRNPGKVLSASQLSVGLTPMTRTKRRMDTLIEGLRANVGDDKIVDVPRRGWMYVPASD